MSSIILNTPVLLFSSVIAVILALSVNFVKSEKVGVLLGILSFIVALANTVYALLLGSDLREILTYVLTFLLLETVAVLHLNKRLKSEDRTVEKNENENQDDKQDNDRGLGV